MIIELQRRGFKVVAAQIPFTSFTDDVAALRRVLRRQDGPVVLVGHSNGGAVITAAGAGESNVKVLVYIAAVVPDERETVGEIFEAASLRMQGSETSAGLEWTALAER